MRTSAGERAGASTDLHDQVAAGNLGLRDDVGCAAGYCGGSAGRPLPAERAAAGRTRNVTMVIVLKA